MTKKHNNNGGAAGGFQVLIAEDNPTSRRCLKNQLESLGHTVAGVAKTGPEVVEMAAKLKPSFIVMDVAMPGMDGISAAKKITEKTPIPIIIVSGHSSDELTAGAIEAGVFAYLVKPITKKELLPAIKLAFARYNEFRNLKDEMEGLSEALETRKLVEKAKGILMKRCTVSEDEAFKLLQSYSQKENKKLKDIAEMIISASSII